MHYTLTVALTATLTIEWVFSSLADFARATTAARNARAGAPVVDVDDLQHLIDETLAPFGDAPMEGNVVYRMFSAQATQSAIAA